MLLRVCLAIATRICHANAQTGPVPVIGMATGVDQATGKVPARRNINVVEQEGGPMWYGVSNSRIPLTKFLTSRKGTFSSVALMHYRTNRMTTSDLISRWQASPIVLD